MKPETEICEDPNRQSRFTVGRDRHGWWIVTDALDLVGGLFADRHSALHFAVTESNQAPGAVRCLEDTVILKFGPIVRRRAAPRAPARRSA